MRPLSFCALLVAGCTFSAPDFADTSFRCERPPHICPDGFACIDGVCTRRDADGTPTDDARPPAPTLRTVTFGERTGADISGVTADAFMRRDNPYDEFGSSHQIEIDAIPERIGLLRFDISAIPKTATVVSAELIVYVTNPIESGEYVAHRLEVAWREHEVDYLRPRNGASWPAPGGGLGSFEPGPVAAFAARSRGDYVVDLSPAAVQAWVAAPETNHGLRWTSTSPDGRGGTWRSRESRFAAERPMLRVTYH